MLKKKYEEMPIEELALFLESYNKDDFMPEAQSAINVIIEARQDELDEYRKQKPEDDLADEIESIDNGRTKARRKVKCKYCGFKGVVEAHDTQKYPRDKIFKL